LDGTRHHLFYTSDVNVLGENINTTDRNIKTILNFSKELGLEVNAEERKCMFISCHQTTGQNHYVKMVYKSFENVAECKCARVTLTDQNCIHGKVKNRQDLGNACYYEVQNILSYCLLSKKHK
jgi:hypothetical protein